MSGYTPVFASVFDGTLHGRWPHTGVWLCLLAMTDRHGHIDRAPKAIASAIGIDSQVLLECIADFCAPDPDSRTAESDGRRMELIDPTRPWGWRIVNHGKYREKARKASFDAQRVADGRNAERMADRRKTEIDPTRPDATRANPPSDSDSDSDSDTDKNPPAEGRARKRATRRCPDDWKPSPEDVAKIRAECPGVDLAAAERKFRDHEFAKARSDWSATWRNWMRTDQERAGKAGKPRLTKYEESMARLNAASREPQPITNPLLLGLKP